MQSAEIYNPRTDRWTLTGPLHDGRFEFGMTLLDNGKVLAVGGWTDRGTSGARASAEIYDPATGTWTTTGALSVPRAQTRTVALDDGRVLALGGDQFGITGTTATAEVFDPATGTWAPTGSMSVPRDNPAVAVLRDGRVLVAGGPFTASPSTRSAVFVPRGATGP